MRTTLSIDDDLYVEAKVEAARRGVSVTSVIEEALRALLSSSRAVSHRPSFPVSERSGGVPRADVSDPSVIATLLYGTDVEIEALLAADVEPTS